MIKIGIVGTGGMANSHANEFDKIDGCKCVAACDIDEKRVKEFAVKHNIKHTFTNIDDMLANADLDAVSNVTPDAFHKSISLKAIEKGKHILCEKPLAVNYQDACEMAESAQKKDVINMVNLSYRCSSALQAAHEHVQAGKIGSIKHFEASYLQSWLISSAWGDWKDSPGLLWRLSTQHGSKGTLGDIGVHILDFTTYPAGAAKSVNCMLKTFDKVPGNQIGEYVFDANDSALITLELENGAIGVVHTTRWATGHMNSLRLRIFGDKGALSVDLDEGYDKLSICQGENIQTAKWETISCGHAPNVYECFIESIKTGKNAQPDFARGAEVQQILDACFDSAESGKTVVL